MEGLARKPFQGVANIIRFNWHFYVLAALLMTGLLFIHACISGPLSNIALVLALAIFYPLFMSLMVSLYVYDLSDLYTMNWLEALKIPAHAEIVNIHAGFDETSALLAAGYPGARLRVFDFYDTARHTEVSIRRARKAYPPYPGTVAVDSSRLPLEPASVDVVFCILSAHEIRDSQERSRFFKQVGTALKPQGKIIVVEHLRDVANFVAYTIGFFHFYSCKSWKKNFAEAELKLANDFNITPFITGFILQRYGTAS